MSNQNNIFAIVPIDILQDSRLTFRQFRILVALLSFRNKSTNLTCPTREQLSERCGLHISHISNTTTELCDLGWLKKTGKGGFSKSTRYEICVPDIESTLADLATVAKTATVADLATRMPVADLATLTVADLATRKEQTIKQTIEQTISKTEKKLTFILPEWVNKNHWDAWHLHPKRKKLTDEQKQIALHQLDLWRQAGLDYAQALKNSAMNSYQGIFLPDRRQNDNLRHTNKSAIVTDSQFDSWLNSDNGKARSIND